MWNTFKYTILTLIREKNVLIWAMIFPLALATIFNFMFANLDDSLQFDPVPVAVVKDHIYEENEFFVQLIETVSEPGKDQLLAVQYVDSVDEANELLNDAAIEGYLCIDQEGIPSYSVTILHATTSIEGINRTIVKTLLDTYVQDKELLESIIETNPAALADASLLETLTQSAGITEEVQITAGDPSASIRYFYALLGFTTLMAANIALTAISATLANISALGARRSLGGTTKLKTLSATFLASWLLSFACLLVAFLLIRLVFGISFGGKESACILALLVGSLVSTSLGSLVGALPRLSEGVKAGIMTGLTCFLALFAGLYGEAAMQFADEVARTAPWVQWINPTKQVSDAFYSLYFYEDYSRYFECLGVLIIVALVLFVGAAALMRRHRYASL